KICLPLTVTIFLPNPPSLTLTTFDSSTSHVRSTAMLPPVATRCGYSSRPAYQVRSMTVYALGVDDIDPERLDFLGLEQPAPGRHLVLALRDRIDEALVLVVREFAQVGRALRVHHARAVARRAVALVDVRARLQLLRVLRRRRAAGDHCEREQDALHS